ncbi:MAG: L-seryl-tRNA(Sec) selenium transferase, partial [candidate division NC10 bacterium]|nr:L-seryl-tRNA(Sec) selenium transferase [candidate division NC10 bacterium]
MSESTQPEVGTILRKIPAVDELLATPRIQDLLAVHPRWAVLEAVREVLAGRRGQILRGEVPPEAAERLLSPAALSAAVAEAAGEKAGPSLVPVINATGVVLHTNLGRAPLAPAAVRAIEAAARGYVNLEFDLAAGRRGSRQTHVEALLCALTGAEAGLVVNNNAAAVLLAINTIASGKEILVSRGQLVEIGDSFRIPDVMVRAGGRLREVGTTNRTHLRDYEEAIGPESALVLRVHRSNFQVLGFTADVETADLVALAKRRGLLVMEDLGSGALLDLSLLGLRREPLASDAIRAGVDLVTFSGDKLLGGPQAGVLVGRRDLLERARRNPLARAVRIDKLSLAALEATLRLYREPERALLEIPILRMLRLTAAAIGARALALAGALRSAVPDVAITLEDETSEVGGGALPLQAIPTRVLALRPGRERATDVEARLLGGSPPVLVRIKEDRLLLDLRTVAASEEAALLQALRAALTSPPAARTAPAAASARARTAAAG